MDEAQTAEVLERKLKVKPGSLLYIQSTVPLKNMQKLCSKYKCFNRDTVWKERSEEVRPSSVLPPLQLRTALKIEHADFVSAPAVILKNAATCVHCFKFHLQGALTHIWLHADSIQEDISGAVIPHFAAGGAWHGIVWQHPFSVLRRAGQEVLSCGQACAPSECRLPNE